MIEVDYPKVRESMRCPVCRGPKGKGLVCCWHCYREHRVKYGNPKIEAIFAEEENRP